MSRRRFCKHTTHVWCRHGTCVWWYNRNTETKPATAININILQEGNMTFVHDTSVPNQHNWCLNYITQQTWTIMYCGMAHCSFMQYADANREPNNVVDPDDENPNEMREPDMWQNCSAIPKHILYRNNYDLECTTSNNTRKENKKATPVLCRCLCARQKHVFFQRHAVARQNTIIVSRNIAKHWLRL